MKNLSLFAFLLSISILAQASPKIQQSTGKIILGTRNCTSHPSLWRYDESGKLDASFGNAGVSILTQEKKDYAYGIGAHQSAAYAIAPDDSIYVLMDKRTPENLSHFQVLKLSKKGFVDPHFGVHGRVDLESTVAYNQIAVGLDGTVYVGGLGIDKIAVTRIRECEEKPFHTIRYPLPLGTMLFNGFALQSDSQGSIFHAGPGLLKINRNGVIDNNFGDGGFVLGPVAWEDVAFQRDGKIVAATHNWLHTVHPKIPIGTLARYLPNGKLDQAYGDYGSVTPFSTGISESISTVTVDAAGNAYTGSHYSHPNGGFNAIRIRKYDVNGGPAMAFGENGILNRFYPGVSPTVTRLQIDAKGRLLVMAGLEGGGTSLSRISAHSGSFDPSFNSGKEIVVRCR